MEENYNREHAASIGFVEDAIINSWEKMQVWMLQHIDQLDYVVRIVNRLREARAGSGTSAMELADKVKSAVDEMVIALRDAGAIITEDTVLSEFATLITKVSAKGYEICLLGKSGTHYSVVEWNNYIAQHGTEPEEAVPAVISPYQSFVIGKPEYAGQYPTKQWGNTTDTVTGLYTNQTGSFVNVLQNGLIFQSLENTYRMLLWYNPEILPHTDYDPDDPDKNYGSYGCVRFATHAEMENSGQMLMSDQQVYIVTTDTDGASNVAYYWSGAAYTKRWPVPRVANNVTGSPAAEFAWQYKAWNGDTRQWTLPTINHLLMMYVYYTQINECLSALNHSTLPSGNSWSCQQNNANNANYVTIPSGNVNYTNKTGTLAVVPVAAL